MRNRSEYRQKMSEKGQRAAEIRWANYHADIPPVPELDPTKALFELEFKNLTTGESHALTFYPGPRLNNYRVEVDGKAWKVCGFVKAIDLIVTSCYKHGCKQVRRSP